MSDYETEKLPCGHTREQHSQEANDFIQHIIKSINKEFDDNEQDIKDTLISLLDDYIEIYLKERSFDNILKCMQVLNLYDEMFDDTLYQYKEQLVLWIFKSHHIEYMQFLMKHSRSN